MQIAIDVREALVDQPAGKGLWTRKFVEELAKREHRLTFYSDRDTPQNWLDHGHAQSIHTPGLRWHLSVAKHLKTHSPDLYCSPTSFIVPARVGAGVPTCIVVHDLIAFQKGRHDIRARLIEHLTLKKACKNARHICTVSRSTQADLLHQFPKMDTAKVVPIFAGPAEKHPSLNTPDQKTILCIGTLSPRKNQLRLVQAYDQLPQSIKDQYRLVLVGRRGWSDAAIVKAAKETVGAEWIDYAPQATCDELLSSCTVFALPSLYEGFGLPVLDALQRGVPVLTSQRGSLKEVAGECAVFVDPESVESIANGLETLLSDTSQQKILRENGPRQAEQFSWKTTVDLFLETVST